MLGPSIGGRSSVAPDGFGYLGFRTRLSQGRYLFPIDPEGECHITPAATLVTVEFRKTLGAALSASYRGGTWFESTAAHQPSELSRPQRCRSGTASCAAHPPLCSRNRSDRAFEYLWAG